MIQQDQQCQTIDHNRFVFVLQQFQESFDKIIKLSLYK